jgi:hypothetical protein
LRTAGREIERGSLMATRIRLIAGIAGFLKIEINVLTAGNMAALATATA